MTGRGKPPAWCISRRDWLGLAATTIVVGCGTEDEAPSRTLAEGDALLGLYPSAEAPTAEEALRRAARRLDWSWLGRGDSVFVKLACNSGRAHPAVTAPGAVRGLCRELFERGAGRVIVGDQSGVESVRLAPGDVRVSSTRDLMENNGLYAAIVEAGAEPHFFDDHGFDAGYFEATLPMSDKSWKAPLRLPSILRDVDHVVYLPRLSSHAVCGYTHGHKLAMGFLRDDSRNHVHHDAATIYEKYVEINYATELLERFRLAISVAESVMLHFGPDTGTVAPADPRIVVASRSLVAHDVISVPLLLHLTEITPPEAGLKYSPGTADAYNYMFLTQIVEAQTGVPWGPGGSDGYTPIDAHRHADGIAMDRSLARAFALTGGAPESVRVVGDGAPLADDVRSFAEAWSGGRIRYVSPA